MYYSPTIVNPRNNFPAEERHPRTRKDLLWFLWNNGVPARFDLMKCKHVWVLLTKEKIFNIQTRALSNYTYAYWLDLVKEHVK